MILTPVFDSPFSSVFTQSTLDSMVRALFVNGAQGGMWDPSDLSTLFQDSAGTTPVTAVEQTVGRMLDKSGNGNHFVQATASKRPKLSRRYNMVGDITAITNGTSTLKPGYFNGIDGVQLTRTYSGDETYYQLAPSLAVNVATFSVLIDWSTNNGTATLGSCYLFDGSQSHYVTFQVGSGVAPLPTFGAVVGTAAGVSASAELLYGSVYRLTFKVTTAAVTVAYASFYVYSGAAVGSPGRIIGQPSVVATADDSLPYQRVTSASYYDADPAKFPAYLSFDGVDDIYDTVSTVPFSSQQMLACLGFTKLSDVTTAVSFELNDYYSKAPGGFGLLTPDNAMTSALACGCAGSSTTSSASAAGYPAPLSSVLTGLFDTGGSIPVTLRHNGAIIGTNPDAVGAVNFGNFALHMGARVGPTYPLLGRIYCAVALEGNITPEAVNTIERWSAQRLRISL